MSQIESFNIENPPNLYKRGSGFSSSTESEISEEGALTNDNIIFQEDSLDIGKKILICIKHIVE